MKNLLLGLTLISISSCATILNDKLHKINVTATKKEVEGTIDGAPFHAPGIVAVPRTKHDKIMKVSTPGCEQEMLLKHEVDPKFFINILSGGTFGSTTDYSSEKMWKYQDQIIITCPN